ncbi:MAG TPA: aminotransferase class I/II-fold pyridoxal phosphate-dependent enzyme [Anaerolineales bacterium]|nr:aminotransferase class I/II-fold pyridoxal phosphate-dependent enzyme [Anaerolineales bacterium]
MSLTPFQLERYFEPFEQTIAHLLCSSDCQSMNIGELLAFAGESSESFLQTWLGYTDYAGAPGLRAAIAALYPNVTPQQIIVHTGAEEAIHNFIRAAFQPKDHIIAHYPGYQSSWQVALDMGLEVDFWRANPQADWALDLAELRRLLRPNTRAVLINTPHNPTGWLMPANEFAELNQLSIQHGFWLFSDEVYRLLEYEPAQRLPNAADINPLAISLGVTSKAFGLAGLRIGWVATQDPHILQTMSAAKDYTSICNPAPSEFLAEIALRKGLTLAEQNLAIIRENLPLVQGFFARHSAHFDWQTPSAGPIAFPRLRLPITAQQFAERARQEAGVLLLPGDVYAPEFSQYFRIGYGRRTLPTALQTLENWFTHALPNLT